MLPEDRIKRINELAKKAKNEGLTAKEKKEQKKLRDEYLKIFRENFRSQLENIEIVDPEMEEEVEEAVDEIVHDDAKRSN